MIFQHALPQEEALERIKRLFEELKADHSDQISDLQEEWFGNSGDFSFTARGFSISGSIIVGTSTVKLAGTLPFAAALFRGKIENAIREKVQTLLA